MTAPASAHHSGNTSNIRAGIYCRISLADSGDRTKVEDQERICRQLCARLGWEVHDVYSDNSISAWNRKKRRPEWERMLADVNGGHLAAIVAYHGDRLYRQPRDLEKLIDLAEGKGLLLASPMGEFDLSTSQGRIFARMLAAIAEGESARHSERRIQQYERWRLEGKVRPGGRGGRAFGFATDGVTQLGAGWCIIATREEISEPALIREAAELVLQGEPTGQVAAWLNSKGARTPTGAPFAHGTVRKMLARPRYAGLMPDGVSKAAWEPVIDRDTWEAVCAMLDSRAAGFSYATNARKYLLSGIATCGECKSGLQIRAERAAEFSGYGCVRPGCRKVQRNARLLDAYVTGAVVTRLGQEGNPAGQVPAVPGLAAEFRALTEQRAEIREALADHTRGHVSLLLARLDSLDRRLEALRQLSGDDAMARLRRAHAGITREEFGALPLGVRRSLVTACVDVVVLRASRRGPGFRTEDVRVTPR